MNKAKLIKGERNHSPMILRLSQQRRLIKVVKNSSHKAHKFYYKNLEGVD